MNLELRRSLVEYGKELFKGFYSLIGAFLVALGLIGIFWADAAGLHILGVIAVAGGVLLAPFFAFHHVRLQRDSLVAQASPFVRIRFANALSQGNWAIDSFGSTTDDGLAARAIVAAEHSVAVGTEMTSALAEEVAKRLRNSAIEGYLKALSNDERPWEVVTPTNEWVITARRDPVPVDDGWEAYARCIVQLPRSFGGRFPVAAVDVVLRPSRDASVPDVQFNPALSPSPTGSARLDLPAVRDLLAALATTAVSDIGEPIFPQIVEFLWRRRFGIRRRDTRLRIAGPNLDLRSRPRTLSDVLDLPDAPRREGAPDTNQIYAETPDTRDATDPLVRHEVIVDALIRCLKQLEFTDPESVGTQLLRTTQPPEPKSRVSTD